MRKPKKKKRVAIKGQEACDETGLVVAVRV